MFNWLLNVVNSGVIDNSSNFNSSKPSNTTTTTVSANFNPTALLVAIFAVIVFVLIVKICTMNTKIKEIDEKLKKHFPEENDENQTEEE